MVVCQDPLWLCTETTLRSLLKPADTQATVVKSDYAQLMRQALKDRSIRAVAAELADAIGTELESERRAIYRYRHEDPKKQQIPEPRKAEALASILDFPALADVPGRAAYRRDRLRELEEEVSRIRQEHDAFVKEVSEWRAQQETRIQELATRQSGQPSSARESR